MRTPKPCPVCGKEPSMAQHRKRHLPTEYYVSCTDMGCIVGPSRPTEEQAADDWDRLYMEDEKC